MATLTIPCLDAALDALVADHEVAASFAALVQERGPAYYGRTMEAGGCLIIAEALRRILGGTLIPISVRSSGAARVVEHIVIAVEAPDGPRWIDRFGMHEDLDDLLHWLEDDADFDRPQAEPAVTADAMADRLLYSSALVEAAVARLRAAFARC